MNAAWGRRGGDDYGNLWDAFKVHKSDDWWARQVNFTAPSVQPSVQPTGEDGNGSTNGSTNGNAKVSAQGWADLMTGVGSATGGIASLIHGGKAQPSMVQGLETPGTPPQPPTDNTGLILLGVGGITILALAGLAMNSNKSGRRR